MIWTKLENRDDLQKNKLEKGTRENENNAENDLNQSFFVLFVKSFV